MVNGAIFVFMRKPSMRISYKTLIISAGPAEESFVFDRVGSGACMSRIIVDVFTFSLFSEILRRTSTYGTSS